MTIDAAIRKAISEARGDVDEAVRRAKKYLEADPAVYDEFVDGLVRKVLRDAVHEALTEQGRAGVPRAMRSTPAVVVPAASSVPRPSLVRGYNALATEELLAYQLRNGKRLADATKREVLAEADYHEQVGAVHRAYTVWFRLIAEVLVDFDQTVSAKFTETSLKALQKIAGERVR